MTQVVIVAAARTPIGSFMGSLSGFKGHELGARVIQAALERARVAPAEVSEVILGQILTAGQGMNPARQASLLAGLPQAVPAWGINMVCGSGLRALCLGAQAIGNGDSRIVVAGGQESMSNATHAAYLRSGKKMGAMEFVDTMLKDGLWDAMYDYHMGTTAENVARQWQITREDQDAFAAQSQNRAEAAQKAGRFQEEIVPIVIKGRKGEEQVFDQDEFIRPGTTRDALAKLKPAFDKDGTVTAGNASGINDGAAALVMMSADEAERRGLEPLARVVSWGQAAIDPSIMGTAPVPASKAALEKAGWKAEQLDLVEANEAFAAQACAVNKDMGWDPEKVNVNGGSIALGHPIGASGGRVMTTLLHEMKRRRAKRGLATLCIGGGMGIAMCVERP